MEEGKHKMRLQTGQEFHQRDKKLNKKLNVNHFDLRLNKGHAIAAEQKMRELKKKTKIF